MPALQGRTIGPANDRDTRKYHLSLERVAHLSDRLDDDDDDEDECAPARMQRFAVLQGSLSIFLRYLETTNATP